MFALSCWGRSTMTSKKINPSVTRTGPPEWTHSLQFLPELAGGFTAMSDGWRSITPNHLVRERKGITVTDAARWSQGMTQGKHVFEIFWPDSRGHCSCIGIGSADVGLKLQGRVSLVGEHSQSWSLDLTKRRTLHKGAMETRLQGTLPHRFFMYVDLDGGNVAFSDDVNTYGMQAEFYGYILTNIPKNPSRPLYVMVSSCAPNETMQVYYRGTATPFGGFSLCKPMVNVNFVVPQGSTKEQFGISTFQQQQQQQLITTVSPPPTYLQSLDQGCAPFSGPSVPPSYTGTDFVDLKPPPPPAYSEPRI